MKKKFLSLLLAICLAIPCMFSFVACEQTETPPELDGAKTFRYDFTIHGTQLSYVVEVPAEEYEGHGRLSDLYIENANGKRLELGTCSDFYDKEQPTFDFDALKFKVENVLEFDGFGEYVGLNYISHAPTTFIPSFEMLEGVYTPTETTLATIQTSGYTQEGLSLYPDGTCCLVGIWGTYYPISLMEIIIIGDDTKASLYVKLDNKTSKYETSFRDHTVFGAAQLNEYYDMCLSNPSEMKHYQGSIDDDVCQLTIDDKYFLIKTLVDERVYFGEYTIEENIMSITVKNYTGDGQVASDTATLSLDDEQGTFAFLVD